MSKVLLNVYDLNEMNDSTYQFGFGAFHSGVEIHGKEWTFASGGVFFTPPQQVPPPAKFRETIDMGQVDINSRDLDFLLDELRSEFIGDDYHILLRNCNHFANAFIQKLLQKEIPGYVNRLAFVGSMFTCLMPPSLLNENPVDATSNNSRQTTKSSQPKSFTTTKGTTLGGGTSSGDVVDIIKYVFNKLSCQCKLKKDFLS